VSADVRVTKTGPAAVVPGHQVTYEIEVVNVGPSDAHGVSLADPTPTGLTFVSASAPCAAGFPCALGSLAAGATRIVTVTLAVPSSYTTPDPIVNTATATATTPDPSPANNSGSAATGLDPAVASLTVTRVCTPPGPVAPGDTLTCVVTVTNTGPSTADNVTLGQTLSEGLAFVSLTAPAGWNCVTPPVGSSGLVSCAKPQVPPGVSVITVVARVLPGATGTVATPTVLGSTTPNPSGNTSDGGSPRPVVTSANLRVTKTGPARAGLGSHVLYQITVTNQGPGDAQAVVISDPTPAGLTLVSVSAPCAGGFPCALGTLAAGAGVQIHATYRLDAFAAPLRNSATVSSSTTDPDPADNSAVHDTAFPVPATLTKGFASASIPLGGSTALTFTLTNPNVATTLTGIGFTDPLPDGLVIATPNGLTGTCGGGTITATAWSTSVSLAGAALAAGASCSFAVDVVGTTPGSKTNTTSALASSGGPGSAATASLGVLGPDLAIAKSHTGNFVKGQTGTYTITVSNVGGGPTSGPVTVTDTLPAGLTATAMSGDGWTCNAATASCTRGDALAAGGSYPAITLTVDIDLAAANSVDNTATVTGDGDVGASNNSAIDPTTLDAPAIPTLSTIAQVTLVLAIVLGGLVMLRRRRRVRVS
jgi:uncharacterized repeat protein (TIGR01451 family)